MRGAPGDRGAYSMEGARRQARGEATPTLGEESWTLYLFNSLELRRTNWTAAEQDYALTPMTEVAYLFANGVRLARLAYEPPGDVPAINGENLHVFFELGDHLGSTSVVLDKATGELVERSTYQAYGGTESDYRPERWKSFREDYRFTGKEEDVEAGLIYFGKRFLNPLLNRWVSADPLAIHGLGADPNLYAYVRGSTLRRADTNGLDDAEFNDAKKQKSLDEYLDRWKEVGAPFKMEHAGPTSSSRRVAAELVRDFNSKRVPVHPPRNYVLVLIGKGSPEDFERFASWYEKYHSSKRENRRKVMNVSAS